jgi:hypothetical protein
MNRLRLVTIAAERTNERTGHIAIHRAFGPPEEFSPDLPRGGRAHLQQAIPGRLVRSMARLWYNHISVAGAMTLTNAEKQSSDVVNVVGMQAARQAVRRVSAQRERGIRADIPDVMVFRGASDIVELKSRSGLPSKAQGRCVRIC